MSTLSMKSVIVTGGCSGIGLAMARYFASQGHIVTIFDIIHSDPGHRIASTLEREFPDAKVAFKRCDVVIWGQLAAAFKEVYEEHGSVDIVMANAGISEQGATTAIDFEEETPTKPRLDVLDVNLDAVISTIKLATHYMNKKRSSTTGSRGSIICTASNAGLYPFPVAPLYAASKFAVIGLVRSLARPLAKRGIQINGLAPAVLETNIAPSKDLFKNMTITPMDTLVRGVARFIESPNLTGEIAEIHGDKITNRPPHEVIDEDSANNLEEFYKLGYA